MNESHLSEDIYSVVKLDGEECNDVKLETIKEWYFNRQINDSSLIFSDRVGKWQTLKNSLNVEELKVEYSKRFSSTNNYENQVSNDIHPTSQFDSHSQNTQYNQTTETQYNQFAQQNTQNQTYLNNPANQTYHNPQTNYAPTYQQQSVIDQPIKAYRLACVFFLTNFFFWVVSVCITIYFGLDQTANDSGNDFSYKLGQEIGRNIIKIIIDFSLATSLWNALNTDTKARLFAIGRTYFGTLLYLVIILPFFAKGLYFVGISSFASIMFFAVGLLILLHGKSRPTNSRVTIGYVCYFLFIATTILSLYSLTPILSDASTNKSASIKLEKKEVKSKEFSDPSVGVVLKLPQGWKQFDPKESSKARGTQMTGKHTNGKRQVSLVINKFTKEKPLVNYKTVVLNQAAENMESTMRQMDKTFKSLSISSVKVGSIIGKRVIYEGTIPDSSRKIKGHIILAIDDDAVYVLTMSSHTDDYMSATSDFMFLESNFTVSDKE